MFETAPDAPLLQDIRWRVNPWASDVSVDSIKQEQTLTKVEGSRIQEVSSGNGGCEHYRFKAYGK